MPRSLLFAVVVLLWDFTLASEMQGNVLLADIKSIQFKNIFFNPVCQILGKKPIHRP